MAATKKAVHLEYDPETDLLNIDLQDPETPLAYGEEVESGVIAHYGVDGSLVSLEIHDVSKRYAAQPLQRNQQLDALDQVLQERWEALVQQLDTLNRALQGNLEALEKTRQAVQRGRQSA